MEFLGPGNILDGRENCSKLMPVTMLSVLIRSAHQSIVYIFNILVN